MNPIGQLVGMLTVACPGKQIQAIRMPAVKGETGNVSGRVQRKKVKRNRAPGKKRNTGSCPAPG